MKKLLLVLILTVTGLSGCYVVPYGNHDDGYRRDRDHREGGDRERDDYVGGQGREGGDYRY